jgi:hypothetical protein
LLSLMKRCLLPIHHRPASSWVIFFLSKKTASTCSSPATFHGDQWSEISSRLVR